MVLAHLFLSISEEGSFVWIAVEGRAICRALQFDKEGLTHTTLRNKDLPMRIRYYSIPESSDWITWIPGRVRNCVCMLNR